jgi:SAM-dependent methyltransferase
MKLTEPPAMTFDNILAQVDAYYTQKIKSHGATASGVDWNSPESQTLRFEQILKVCGQETSFSINDYGCGYGALADYLAQRKLEGPYCGFDISTEMISAAQELHKGMTHCRFVPSATDLPVADYTVASGIFNVRLENSSDEWDNYILHTLHQMASVSKRGFSFNALTKYSDADKMRDYLHYTDPLALFDYCKRHFSRFVALLHDYPLYEFTLLVRL